MQSLQRISRSRQGLVRNRGRERPQGSFSVPGTDRQTTRSSGRRDFVGRQWVPVSPGLGVNPLAPTASLLAMFLTTVVDPCRLTYERLKTWGRESHLSWCVHWWSTGASILVRPLLVAALFAGLGLWLALSLSSHGFIALLVVGIALVCAVFLPD